MMENRLVGMKSRGVYETPGGTILTTVVWELESLTLDRETMQAKDIIALKYAEQKFGKIVPLCNGGLCYIWSMVGQG